MKKKLLRGISCILVVAEILAACCACGDSDTMSEEYVDSDAALLLIIDNMLTLYDKENETEYIIDETYSCDETLSSMLCTRAQFSADGAYLIYFSKPDDCYQLNVLDWEAVCDNPNHVEPVMTAYDVTLENFQVVGDNVGFVTNGTLQWCSLNKQTRATVCSFAETDIFYIADDVDRMLVTSHDGNALSISMYSLDDGLSQDIIEPGSDDVRLLSYTVDLNEIVTQNDSGIYLTRYDGSKSVSGEREELLSSDVASQWGLYIGGENNTGDTGDIPLADANTVCVRPLSVGSPTTLLVQNGEIVPLTGQVQIYSTDKFRAEIRKANSAYGSTYYERLSATSPFIGFYYSDDEAAEYIFTNGLIPFRTSLDGNFYDATFDPIHNILYWCAGVPKKGYYLYAYSFENNQIVNETLISSSCQLGAMTFDSATGTLFYFESDDSTDTGYTLYCILDGNILDPQRVLDNVGFPISQSAITGNGALQFEEGTGQIFCWTDVDYDLNVGNMYQIEIEGSVIVAKIGDQVSYMAYGRQGNDFYYVGAYSSYEGGILYRNSGNESDEILTEVQGIISTYEHHSNYAGYFS